MLMHMNTGHHHVRCPRRRRFFAQVGAVFTLSALPFTSAHGTDGGRESRGTIRIGLTPVFLDDQMNFNARWRSWFEEKLERPVVFVQRGSYRDIVDLLRSGKIDFAWLCGFPYVRHRREIQLVAVPVWRGQPLYQSYLVADAGNLGIRSLADLRGTVFAYSDPDSNSGFLYPQFQLRNAQVDPASYFSRTFFTWSHSKVVEAVSLGLANGGAVDGYVWETLAQVSPDLARGTRVIEKSPFFGHPPFVARQDISPADLQCFRSVLLGMATDTQGMALLRRLRLDGFQVATPELYDGIARMVDTVLLP
jgi:phosphonate transport system substrate-binding protein